MNAIEAAEHAGIDLSLIDESLRLTPEQRALQHQAALTMALQLEKAFRANTSRMDNQNGGTQQSIAEAVRR
jgi:pheromone shutdown protein TraB